MVVDVSLLVVDSAEAVVVVVTSLEVDGSIVDSIVVEDPVSEVLSVVIVSADVDVADSVMDASLVVLVVVALAVTV